MTKDELLAVFEIKRKKVNRKEITEVSLMTLSGWTALSIFLIYSDPPLHIYLQNLDFWAFVSVVFILGIISLMPAIAIIFAFKSINKRKISNNKVYQSFLKDSNKITKLYPRISKLRSGMYYSIILNDEENNEFELEGIKNEIELNTLVQEFSSECKNVVINNLYLPK